MSYVTAHIGVTLSIKTSSPRCTVRVYESPNGVTSAAGNFEGYVLLTTTNAPGAQCPSRDPLLERFFKSFVLR